MKRLRSTSLLSGVVLALMLLLCACSPTQAQAVQTVDGSSSHAAPAGSPAVDPAAAAAAPDTALPPIPDASSAAASTPVPEFVPTHEWQTVLPGQALPAGLWVRMDMSTGAKTARLLPEDEQSDAEMRRRARAQEADAQGLVVVPETEQPSDASSSSNDGPLLRELPHPSSVPARDESLPALASDESLRLARQQRLAQLKEAFYLKEDAEQMKQLLSAIVSPSASVREVLAALENLEEFLHQVDNANDFVKIGGLDVVLTILQQEQEPLLQSAEVAAVPTAEDILSSADMNATASSSSEASLPAPLDLQLYRLYQLQSHAAWLLGTCAQNNAWVQNEVRREGGVGMLVALLKRTMDEERTAGAVVEHASPASADTAAQADITAVTPFQLRASRLSLLQKLFFALSALLRHNGANQRLFRLEGGDQVLQQALVQTMGGQGFCSGADAAVQDGSNCLSPSEARKLRTAWAGVQAKALGLVQDIIVDFVTNARAYDAFAATSKAPTNDAAADAASDADSAATSDAAAAAPEQPEVDSSGRPSSAQPSILPANTDSSDAALYNLVSSPAWCSHALHAAWGAAVHPQHEEIAELAALRVRQAALEILLAQTEAPPAPDAGSTGEQQQQCAPCVRWVVESSQDVAISKLVQIQRQQRGWAAHAREQAAARGEEYEDSYHEELALMVHAILARLEEASQYGAAYCPAPVNVAAA